MMKVKKKKFNFLIIFKGGLNILGLLIKLTYKFKDDTYPNWKYVYFFFYQRILFFNFQVPWPCHPTSFITDYQNVKFGKRTSPGSGPNQYINGYNGIIIGDNVQIGPCVSLISTNHDLEDYDINVISNPIEIGNNVWIGANCVIMPGINIGNNVVIGAGSIVTKNIPENSIAFGNPCKVVKEKSPYLGK